MTRAKTVGERQEDAQFAQDVDRQELPPTEELDHYLAGLRARKATLKEQYREVADHLDDLFSGRVHYTPEYQQKVRADHRIHHDELDALLQEEVAVLEVLRERDATDLQLDAQAEARKRRVADHLRQAQDLIRAARDAIETATRIDLAHEPMSDTHRCKAIYEDADELQRRVGTIQMGYQSSADQLATPQMVKIADRY